MDAVHAAIPDFAVRYLEQALFHHIDATYPGLSCISEAPYIFLVDEFLSPDECKSLIALRDSGMAQPSATAPAQRALRTSTSVFPAAGEIEWLRKRMARLLNVNLAQLEPTKITKYECGEYFKKHTDASFLKCVR